MLGESFQENEMFLWLNYIDTFFYLFAIWRLSVSSRTAFLASATCNDELFSISRFTRDWLLLPSRTRKKTIYHECVDNRSISTIKRNTIYHSKSITKLEVKTKHKCRALQRFYEQKAFEIIEALREQLVEIWEIIRYSQWHVSARIFQYTHSSHQPPFNLKFVVGLNKQAYYPTFVARFTKQMTAMKIRARD